MKKNAPTIDLSFDRLDEPQMLDRAAAFLANMKRRRSVRDFRPDPVPLKVLEDCIEAACLAPSGAHKQPWTFVLVTDPKVRHDIREAAEREERAFYAGRATQRWLDDLEPLGTGPDKPFLEEAPALIAVFAELRGGNGDRHYHVSESVGIALGFLIVALHQAGLVTLPHTPSPMAFLSEVLKRPAHERPYVLLPVGYPIEDCKVPDLERKPRSEVLIRV